MRYINVSLSTKTSLYDEEENETKNSFQNFRNALSDIDLINEFSYKVLNETRKEFWKKILITKHNLNAKITRNKSVKAVRIIYQQQSFRLKKAHIAGPHKRFF